MTRAHRRLVAYTHGVEDPAARMRIGQFVPRFERAGWRVSLRPHRPERPWDSEIAWPAARRVHQHLGAALRRRFRRLDLADAGRFDVAFVNRDLLERDPAHEARLQTRNPRIVLDIDDAIHLGAAESYFAAACARAAWVTAGNPSLAAEARRHTDRVSLMPTVVDTGRYPPPPRPDERRPLRLGWLGSDRSIRETLHPHASMLARLQSELAFELVVISRPRRDMPDARLRWRHVEWTPDIETRVAEHFDVGIMPLVDEEFQRFKCGAKLLQYMAAGLPSIASPVGVNTTLVDPGRGHLASDRGQWGDAIVRLRDPAHRQALGAAARRFVEREYSTDVWFPRLLEIVDHVRSGTRPPHAFEVARET